MAEDSLTRHLIATQLQVAVINKMLPKGFKFELLETVKRQNEQSKQQVKQPLPKRRRINEDNKRDEKDFKSRHEMSSEDAL